METPMVNQKGVVVVSDDERTSYRRAVNAPYAVYSLPKHRKVKGSYQWTRQLGALTRIDVFDSGIMLVTFEKVRRERRSGSWVFNGGHIFHTLKASELRDVRFVEMTR